MELIQFTEFYEAFRQQALLAEAAAADPDFRLDGHVKVHRDKPAAGEFQGEFYVSTGGIENFDYVSMRFKISPVEAEALIAAGADKGSGVAATATKPKASAYVTIIPRAKVGGETKAYMAPIKPDVANKLRAYYASHAAGASK